MLLLLPFFRINLPVRKLLAKSTELIITERESFNDHCSALTLLLTRPLVDICVKTEPRFRRINRALGTFNCSFVHQVRKLSTVQRSRNRHTHGTQKNDSVKRDGAKNNWLQKLLLFDNMGILYLESYVIKTGLPCSKYRSARG